jgi:hypothetical protein
LNGCFSKDQRTSRWRRRRRRMRRRMRRRRMPAPVKKIRNILV